MAHNPKKYKLFFSWQSDETDSKKILENALSVAVDELENYKDIKVEVDHSTLGLSGMPNITQTILNKIDECDIFLADITPITFTNKKDGNGVEVRKAIPNANVLLELGYAMSAVGVNYIIPVAHQGKWAARELPFDINHNNIHPFTYSNCDLKPLIESVIKYIDRYGRHRHKAKPYLLHQLTLEISKLRNNIRPSGNRRENILTENSTVFFWNRICDAFPGVRGVKVYTSPWMIHMHLSRLLRHPLQFKKSLTDSTNPVWWFRGDSAMYCSNYKWLYGHHFIIDVYELIIKKIAVYNNNGRYYANYVYIEAAAQKPTGLYKTYTSSCIERLKEDCVRRYVTEEYGVYRLWNIFPIKITRQEYDDGSARICGFIHKLKYGKANLRVRYLTNYNFIVAAQGSSFNCDEFCRTSDSHFNAVLDKSISLEQFHEYLQSFPKQRY